MTEQYTRNANAEKVEWLYKDRFARGMLHIVAGDAGLGKSAFLVSIAATISKGRAWPCGEGEAPKGKVIYFTAEDHLAMIMVPRLMAAKADLKNVLLFVDRSVEGFNLKSGLDFIKAQVKRYPSCKMVIFDPISAFLGLTDSYKDAELRQLLKTLSKAAKDCNIAIVGSAHLNKSQGQKALHRIGGSVAFGAAARIVHLVGEDPDDESKRVVALGKTNIGAKVDGLGYRLEGVEVKSGDKCIETVELKFSSELVKVGAKARCHEIQI